MERPQEFHLVVQALALEDAHNVARQPLFALKGNVGVDNLTHSRAQPLADLGVDFGAFNQAVVASRDAVLNPQ